MEVVYRNGNPAVVSELSIILSNADITHRVVDVPVADWRSYEIWVFDQTALPAVRAIIEQFEPARGKAEPLSSWTCAECGASVEGQFSECWACLVGDDDPRTIAGAECDHCGYLLWRLPSRRCPECGEEF